MHILLTNDDSHASALLEIAIRELRKYADLTVIVPKYEQSWKGKSLSRFSTIHLEAIKIADHDCFMINGTPADCANFGIYNLSQNKPDLVVSGVNAGLNAGLGFVLSSGTIGACLEANIARIPGIALSQAFDTATRNAYVADYNLDPNLVAIFARQIAEVLQRVFASKLTSFIKRESPITLNINFPFALKKDWKLCETFLGHCFYGSLFKKADFGYEHNVVDHSRDDREIADNVVINSGDVSITGIDISTLGTGGLGVLKYF